ncbi:YfjI family protein [Leisingera sp. JC11]|uniref:YfjI family protein n=1 Tax=Leisingera sp. JC11 TaxID=3042469 RepID=UPI0034565CC1
MKDMNPAIVPFKPGDHWATPDLSLCDPDRPPPPKMSQNELTTLFGPWANWLLVAAEVKNAPIDYVALALLTSASAVIGNSRWAVPWPGWKEPPTLWGMLVGDPSSMKSPAQDAVLDPIKTIDDALAESYREERQEWESEDEVARLVLAKWKADAKSALAEDGVPPSKPAEADAGPPPTRRRIRITDVTTEKVAELLAATWRGLLLSRDELAGWLSSMDRYSGGGDRPFWLEAHGGRIYTVDRKSSPEPICIDHLSVSILGGTQPDKLSSLLVKCDDDGLLARFLVAFPDPVPLLLPTRTLDEQRLVEAFQRLRGLSPATTQDGKKRPFYVHLNEAARKALQDFRVQCREWEGETTGLMKSHIGKMPGLVVRVANVLAHLDWCASPAGDPVTEITAAHIGRACHYVGEHLRLHALRAYGAAPPSPEVKLARRLGEMIRREHLTEVNLRELQRRELAGRPNAKQLRAALDVLVEADWLEPIPSQGVGRPKNSYAVNPKLGDLK